MDERLVAFLAPPAAFFPRPPAGSETEAREPEVEEERKLARREERRRRATCDRATCDTPVYSLHARFNAKERTKGSACVSPHSRLLQTDARKRMHAPLPLPDILLEDKREERVVFARPSGGGAQRCPPRFFVCRMA